MTKEQALQIAVQTADAIVETVREMPQGAPAGPMYLAFMAAGMSLDTFEAITSALVDAGKLKRKGNLFFPA